MERAGTVADPALRVAQMTNTANCPVPPPRRRSPWLGLAPGLVLLIRFVLPESPLGSAISEALIYAVLGYMLIDALLSIRSGYLRHRPFWSGESWRRFLTAVAIPVGMTLLGVGMMTALELRLPIVGAPRSPLRGAWALGTIGFLLVGVVVLMGMVERFGQRDPNKPFTWSPRRPFQFLSVVFLALSVW